MVARAEGGCEPLVGKGKRVLMHGPALVALIREDDRGAKLGAFASDCAPWLVYVEERRVELEVWMSGSSPIVERAVKVQEAHSTAGWEIQLGTEGPHDVRLLAMIRRD